MLRLILTAGLLACAPAPATADWLGFRGTDGGGHAVQADLPITWSDKQNIAWKVATPGRGASNALIVGDRVILTCSSGAQQDRLHVLCYNAADGSVRWHRQFWATGHTAIHPTCGVAAPTPVCDGRLIFAFFSSNDLVCLDLDGQLQWYRGLAYDYPGTRNDAGMASSPVVVGPAVVVQMDCQGDSFAAAIDKSTGQTLWRVARKQEAMWCSPVGLTQEDVVLLQSHQGVTAHDAATGKRLWMHEARCSGIPSTVRFPGGLIIPSEGLTMLRLRDAKTAPQRVWNVTRLQPGPATPLVYEGHVYSLSGAGIVSCADLNDGTIRWRLRLKGPFWASPIVAGDHLYYINYDGRAHVVRLGEQGEVVGTSEFGELIQASPAVADNAMYVRSDRHLWKIAKDRD